MPYPLLIAWIPKTKQVIENLITSVFSFKELRLIKL